MLHNLSIFSFIIETICIEQYSRDGMRGHFVPFRIEWLHHSVVSPFMGHIKSSEDGTAIWISAFIKYFGVKLVIEIIDSIIKGNQNNLRGVLSWYTPRNIWSSTAAVWQNAVANVTLFRCCQRSRGCVNCRRSKKKRRKYTRNFYNINK